MRAIQDAKRRFPSVPEIDLYYYALKGFGVDFKGEGHPVLHFMDDQSFFSVTPLIPESSPFRADEQVTVNGVPFPFKMKIVGRMGAYQSHVYFRGISAWMPTLDDRTLLNTNFNPECYGCNFCSRSGEDSLQNITVNEGIRIALDQGTDFASIDQIAIVTGQFKDEESVIKHIGEILQHATPLGFKGEILYLGAQVQSNHGIAELAGLWPSTRYVFTTEMFDHRHRLRPEKRIDLEEQLDILASAGQEGLSTEYSYMPGVDGLESFEVWAPRFAEVGRPHLSIFRPALHTQARLRNAAFVDDPVGYLCSMRQCYEDLHGGPIYADNLANLWPFPANRVNPRLLSAELPDW